MMSKITAAEQSKNLADFFRAPVNMTTRERIFFSRLSFDLKIAASRAGYHLHVYEPDVDRDGFDIVLEDTNGGQIWVQTKAVLSSAKTRQWKTFAEFIRPPVEHMDKFGLDPMQCGRGGGIILIEIDTSSAQGQVNYSYTDYRILVALEKRYIVEEPVTAKLRRGKRPRKVQDVAQDLIAALYTAEAKTPITLPRQVFLKVKEPDGLLALMGLQNTTDFGAYSIQDACQRNLDIDPTGNWHFKAKDDIQAAGTLFYHMTALNSLLDEGKRLATFTFNRTT